MRAYYLENKFQYSDWGSHTAIQNLIGLQHDGPVAEMWMGAHPSRPSLVKLAGTDMPLDAFIAQSPASILGPTVAESFANRLPFLFKLLAAEKCLSIQAHPNRNQARQGFAREEVEGISIDADCRSYRDDNHKPEIICALTEFWGLNAFRPLDDLVEVLDGITLPAVTNELATLRRFPSKSTLQHLLGAVLRLQRDSPEAKNLVQELVHQADKRQKERVEFDWLLRIHRDRGDDPGLLCVLLLNFVHLQPGQAMYCDAGDLHAYLHGFGIELMANSDNVLRGGLTTKYIAKEKLLSVLTFECRAPRIIDAEAVSATEDQYPTPSHEFDLRRIHLEHGSVWSSPPQRSLDILICINGNLILAIDNERMALKTGQSVVVPADAATYRLSGNGTVFKAGTPM